MFRNAEELPFMYSSAKITARSSPEAFAEYGPVTQSAAPKFTPEPLKIGTSCSVRSAVQPLLSNPHVNASSTCARIDILALRSGN
jgi:hypothetical protein